MSNEPDVHSQNQNPEVLSERFGNNRPENHRKSASLSVRKETHRISVRDAAKMFEAAGVARTERSIINWCWPNKQGLVRLDAYFDPNDRKHFITQQSIDLAIKEELSKGQGTETRTVPKEGGDVPKASENQTPASEKTSGTSPKVEDELRKEILDLKITNRAKDMFISKLEDERKGFERERQGYIEQLVADSREIGELKTRLLQLDRPKEERPDRPTPASTSTSSVSA